MASHRPIPSLKAQALALLARREYSRSELHKRLLAHARKLAAAAAQVPPVDPWDHEAAAAQPTPTPLAEAPSAEALHAEVEAVLDWLAARQYQSDVRFVEARVNARVARHGERRIRHELAQHGLALDAETAQQLRSSEVQRAHEVWQKRFGSIAADAQERERQMRFLAARGFSAETVRRVVGGRDPDDE
ncbi:MAG: recombination regulator RecX [Ideonella sp. MAG2]|nr:MAG: recombination regulator RecX [Ideonella sp. MAG2]